MWSASELEIGCLQTRLGSRAASADPATLRLRLSNLLGSADLRPPGMPPAAVLIVRRLADPLPGRLASSRNVVRVGAGWEQAAREALAVYYRHAARPAQGFVPEHAEAVLFADEAELLACLALDLSQGQEAHRWWWRLLIRKLRAYGASERLCVLLCNRAAYVPAALHHLAPRKQIVPVLEALSPTQAMRVLSAVCATHHVPVFDLSEAADGVVPDTSRHQTPAAEPEAREALAATAPRPASRPVEATEQEDTATTQPADPMERGVRARSDHVRPPWSRWVQQDHTPTRLGRARACLAGVGLMLHHNGAGVRAPAFFRALRRWWHHQEKQASSALYEAGPARSPEEPSGTAEHRVDTLSRFTAAMPGTQAIEAAPRPVEGGTQPLLQRVVEGREQADESFTPRKADLGVQRRATQRQGPASRLDVATPQAGMRSVLDDPGALPDASPSGYESAIAPERVLRGSSPPTSIRPAATEATPAIEAEGGYSAAQEPPQGPSTASVPRLPERAMPVLHPEAEPGSETALPVPHPTPGRRADDPLSVSEAGGLSGASGRDAAPSEPALPSDTAVDVHAPAPWQNGVGTQLGGVLYLVNLMDHLDLPDCFEASWRLASEVGPWGVLETLGRALIGPGYTHLAHDALWLCLAALAGREPYTLPGEGFSGNDAFCLPAAWFDAPARDADARYHWAARAERLCLWTAHELLLADLPRDAGKPSAQARDVLHAYGLDAAAYALSRRPWTSAPRAALAGTLAEGLDATLARWVACTIPYVCMRLGRALGLDTADPTALARALLLVPGRLYLTSSHIDLVLPLDAISLPVRQAGLDRDPGWMPTFSRVILFHFEQTPGAV